MRDSIEQEEEDEENIFGDVSDMYLTPSSEGGDDAALMKCIDEEPELDLTADIKEVMELFEEMNRKKQFKKVDTYTSGRPRKSLKKNMHDSETFNDDADYVYPYRHDTETKRRIGYAHRREFLSLESLERMSAAQRGKVKSEETRRKISEANLGRRLSEKTKERMRQAKLGKKRVKKDV